MISHRRDLAQTIFGWSLRHLDADCLEKQLSLKMDSGCTLSFDSMLPTTTKTVKLRWFTKTRRKWLDKQRPRRARKSP